MDFLFLRAQRDDSADAAFGAVPNAAANRDGFLPVVVGAMPVVAVFGFLVKDALSVGQPEDEPGLATAVGHLLLKVEDGGIDGLFEPLDGRVRSERIQGSIETGDDQGAPLDEMESVLLPSGLVEAQELAQAADGLRGAEAV